jgi:UDP-N-acetylglucosamine 2-epimerase
MALTEAEIHIIDIIARYNFLIACRDKGLITEEKRQEIVFTFGPKAIELINYYDDKVEEHQLDGAEYLGRLKKKLKRF